MLSQVQGWIFSQIFGEVLETFLSGRIKIGGEEGRGFLESRLEVRPFLVLFRKFFLLFFRKGWGEGVKSLDFLEGNSGKIRNSCENIEPSHGQVTAPLTVFTVVPAPSPTSQTTSTLSFLPVHSAGTSDSQC